MYCHPVRISLGRTVFASTASLLLLGLCWLGGLRLNLSNSIPIGIYIAVQSPPTRGTFVLVCLPTNMASMARERGYVLRGHQCPGGLVPIGKPVLATAGDTVTVAEAGLLLNGRYVTNSQPLHRDANGRLLPRISRGRYAVASGELWVVSPYSYRSFDSRYFGPIGTSSIQTAVRPLWIARTPMPLLAHR